MVDTWLCTLSEGGPEQICVLAVRWWLIVGEFPLGKTEVSSTVRSRPGDPCTRLDGCLDWISAWTFEGTRD